MLKNTFLTRWARALYICRIPVLMSLVLMLLWTFRGSSMVSGLYAASKASCFLLGFVQTLLAAEIWVLIYLVQLHGAARLGIVAVASPPPPAPLAPGYHLIAAGLAAAPLVFNLVGLAYANGATDPLAYGWFLAAGVATAVAALWAITTVPTLSRKAIRERREEKLIRAIERIDGDGAGFVYFDPAGKHKVLGDKILLAAGFALLSGIAFIAVWWIPTNALISVLLWLSLAGWVMGFLCFFFDRYRVPMLTVAALWGFLVGLCPWDSHYYFLPDTLPAVAAADASDLFAPLPGTNTPRSKIIIVSAEGGGIHAEAWTARVLTGLTAALQQPFLESVRLLSGTSGGSVGNLFFQTLYDNPARLKSSGCWDAIATATTDRRGLDYIAHAMIHYDLTRPIFPSLIGFPKHDRGFALEQAWEAILRNSTGAANCGAAANENVTMDSLRDGVKQGTRPLLVFNATLVDSGWPLAITNFDLKESNGLRIFRSQYEGKNLSLLTAVRLSASFPYVVPSPRPLVCVPTRSVCVKNGITTDRQLAVIDGGLYDNYGVGAAYETLNQATGGFADFHSASVLWLRIRDAPVQNGENPGQPSPRDPTFSLSTSLFGPLYTLFEVRGTGQAMRFDQLTGMAMMSSNGKLRSLDIDFPLVDPQTGQPPALSWALTKPQTEGIESVWQSMSKGKVSQVCAFLRGTPCS